MKKIRIVGSNLSVAIRYTIVETKIVTMDMTKHPPKHPMANSLLIWLMEYLMNSKNMESNLDIGCLDD